MVGSNDNFIPHSIVGNESFLRGTQYITLLLPMREIQTTTVQNHKQQPKLQIKSINRFSISQRSPQNDWG